VGATDVTAHLNGSAAGPETFRAAINIPGPPSSVPCPEGVAACVTVQSAYGSDAEFAPGSRPRARDRNRFYAGPLSGAALAQDTDKRTTLKGSFMTFLGNWLQAVAKGPGVSPDIFGLVTWSKIGAKVAEAIQGWIDDRPDYQRRRADQGTNRLYVPTPETGLTFQQLAT
jgi:hypothetical protein